MVCDEHVEKGECQANFEDSSGGMVVWWYVSASIQKMFSRSIENNNLRYSMLLSDGEIKTELGYMAIMSQYWRSVLSDVKQLLTAKERYREKLHTSKE